MDDDDGFALLAMHWWFENMRRRRRRKWGAPSISASPGAVVISSIGDGTGIGWRTIREVFPFNKGTVSTSGSSCGATHCQREHQLQWQYLCTPATCNHHEVNLAKFLTCIDVFTILLEEKTQEIPLINFIIKTSHFLNDKLTVTFQWSQCK